MIARKSIDEVMSTAQIEEVVSDFVNLKRRGVNLIGLCPFHHEKTPSFTVSPSKQIFKCFGCGEAGNAVGFLMEHEKMSYPEAIRYLADKYQIDLEEDEPTPEEEARQLILDSLYIVNDFARDFFHQQLYETENGRQIGLSYFKERGFREETIKKFELGYAPDTFDGLKKAALNAGFKLEQLREAGLVTKKDYDFFRDRVMFPIRNLSGKTMGFGGRILKHHPKSPKYLNTGETEIYNKRKSLYGLYLARKAIRKQDECLMVEGYTDVISLSQSGFEHVVSSSGTSLTVDQVRLVKRYTNNLKIIYDGDPAGIQAALRGLDLVLEQNMNVRIVLLPEGEDPDSYLKQVGSSAFETYIAEHADDVILFKTRFLLDKAGKDPVKRSDMIRDILESLARIPDPLKRTVYIKECAGILDMEEQVLVNETNRIVHRILKKKRKDLQVQENQRSEKSPSEDFGQEPGQRSVVSPQKRTNSDEFQERDIIRILLTAGQEWYDKEEELTIADFILDEIGDVIEAFENELFKSIIQTFLEYRLSGEELTESHFLNHENKDIQHLAIDFLTQHLDYSPNWEAKLESPLQTQPPPEENFTSDAHYSILRFKLKKINKLCAQNQARLKDSEDEYEQMRILAVQEEYYKIRKNITDELKTVVIH